MSAHLDVSDVNRFVAQLATGTGRVGARNAAAIRKTAYDIETTAKALAPVRSGRLRDSISTTIRADGQHAAIEAEIGPTVPYALDVEYGTSTMAPEPFMQPAFDRHIGELQARLEKITGAL